MILGITGGTGCGKTTLLKQIESRGGMVLDCDAIYHELLETDRQLLNEIEKRFPGVVTDGTLDRKKLGQRVFSDPDALAELNAITHGAVRREVERRLAQKPNLAAIDAIALFESGLAQLCHVTVAVTAPREDRVRRLMKRDGIDGEYAAKRIDAQQPEKFFTEQCGYCLRNDGDLRDFEKKCQDLLEQILGSCNSSGGTIWR